MITFWIIYRVTLVASTILYSFYTYQDWKSGVVYPATDMCIVIAITVCPIINIVFLLAAIRLVSANVDYEYEHSLIKGKKK